MAALILFIGGLVLSQQYLNLDFLVQQESRLKGLYGQAPWFVLGLAFLIYVLVTGLSIPGATMLSLIYAWFFKFWVALLLISFASTTGATLAFLGCRYLLRDWVQLRMAARMQQVNEAMAREGAFYLFMMRLIPAFPFVVVNAVMALTQIRAATFWWVSQLGMLAGTAVYVYAGSTIPDLKTLTTDGVAAVFTPSQLFQILAALLLLGVFPLAARKTIRFIGREVSSESTW